MRRDNLALALVAVIALVAIAFLLIPRSGPPVASASPSPTSSPTPTIVAAATTPEPTRGRSVEHVWWIVMENHEYGSIIGNKDAPYLNSLAAKYALLTNYYATTHPSEPNYIAMVAGSTLGVTGDGTYDLSGDNLFRQAAGTVEWRAYEQDYPGGCFTGSSSRGGIDGPGAAGTYARKHDPAISFTNITHNPAWCADIQPLRDFDPVKGAFEFITPNLINDMHDGTVAQGDAFLRDFVPLILRSPAFLNGVLFITVDEGSTNAGSHGDHGGHVATLVVAPGIKAGTRITTYADHYSLLRTTEDLLALPCLGASCSHAAITW